MLTPQFKGFDKRKKVTGGLATRSPELSSDAAASRKPENSEDRNRLLLDGRKQVVRQAAHAETEIIPVKPSLTQNVLHYRIIADRIHGRRNAAGSLEADPAASLGIKRTDTLTHHVRRGRSRVHLDLAGGKIGRASCRERV